MHPTILIGLDGATYTVLDALAAEGHMPVWQSLVEGGARAVLRSTPHPLTPPAWTTVMTGRTPGHHGIFDFIWAQQRDQRIYFTLNDFRDIRSETIWSMVSRLGGRVATLNYPFMAPPPVLNGAVVPGLVSWKHLRRSVYPPELYTRLQRLPDFRPKELAWDFARERQATESIDPGHHADWVNLHIRRERQWYEVFHHVVRRERCDLSAILIDGVDKLQHVCWKHLDPATGVDSLSQAEREVRRLTIQYFRELDEFLGRVLHEAPQEARVIIVSDHGFGPTETVFRLNVWLAERGYLSWSDTSDMPEAERLKVAKLMTGHFVHLDWANTTAYAQSAATNGIHIRRAERSGEPGVAADEYESFCRRLIDELKAIRVPGTDTPLVTGVLRREETFPGPHAQHGPDLTLTLFDHGFISTADKQPYIWKRPDVAGTHRPEGVFLAKGPGIARGAVLGEQSIVDVAATVLYSLGLAIPRDLESRVIVEAFEASHRAGHPVLAGEPTEAAGSARDPFTAPERDAEEEATIMERLRALGYVE